MYINNNYRHSDITGRIIKCAMQVHSKLGSGFKESIYHRALALELDEEHLEYIHEYEMKVYYRNKVIGVRRSDFYVANCVMVETKAVSELDNLSYAQIINYLEICGIEVGLLINFGAKSLEFKRFINSKMHKKDKINTIGHLLH